jgi:uncharacterized membrane protein YphA (DoxX/SURF4 family)
MKQALIDSAKDKSLSIEFLRVYLGGALFFKGIFFIGHMKDIFEMISYQFPYLDFLLAHYVVLAHIVGGIFLALGLFTRIAAMANIPVLVSALIFVQAKNGVMTTGAELELVALVLVLLLFFVWQGSGYFSVDNYIKISHKKSAQ